MTKKCEIYDRDCIDCGECDLCDLDPAKICDNCGKCIETTGDYYTLKIDKIVTEEKTFDPRKKYVIKKRD